ncbi:MAG: glycosyltransferase family 2 protein [Dysgonamonadaceae bacterium]|nr:glycosyltransferase family 2 protein [Dysgonamonadaceae bacterium]
MYHEKKITCFLPYSTAENVAETVKAFKSFEETGDIFILYPDASGVILPEGCRLLTAGSLFQTQTLKRIASRIDTPYTLLYMALLPLRLGAYSIGRMLQVIGDTGAGMLYADRYQIKEGDLQPCPVIDYQEGSVRDNFDFGSLLLFCSDTLKEAVHAMDTEYEAAALYDLRLKVAQKRRLFHLPEFLYTESETDSRKLGEQLFDYVNPKNRQIQIEMEQAFTRYLKDTGAWLKPEFTDIKFSAGGTFPVEASVVIPVRNREKTVEDAVRSALMQVAAFSFNLIVVDNRSTDQTAEILRKIAASDSRLIHIVPDRNDLGIGGCWNTAVMHPQCGKFAIQLDSDDLYIDNRVIQTVVDAFYEQHCAMIVGTYKTVNFNLEEIPPGVVDHREWTPDNGRNNALRINGLGAPRAFYTPILREIKLPNTSYGEDYAAGLAVSRRYRIGRIYTPLYLCRRWEDNSDASPNIYQQNGHNFYKDCIRTIELSARRKGLQPPPVNN